MVRKFLKRNKGVSSLEYALIASLIAIVIIVAVVFLGGSVKSNFETVSSKVESALHGGTVVQDEINISDAEIDKDKELKEFKKPKKHKKPKKDKHPRKSWWKWF
jgi:pilus assembly protein Flp/PilA